MITSMLGHRLTWGMPTEVGGWQVVANSFPSLTRAQQDDLVARTNVGTVDERGLADGFGYFGEFEADGASWAVFAHLYRSPKPVFTGQHFVQRDICLAPLQEFRDLGYDAQPFFDIVPEPRPFPRVESETPSWTSNPKPDARDERLRKLDALSEEFLRDVMLALLQPHPTIIVWQSPDAALLTALLLLFPGVVRRQMKFCTVVGEVGRAQLHIKCVPAFKPDPTSSIVDFDRRIFRQQLTVIESALPAQLLAARKSNRLSDLHAYIDDVVAPTADQTAFVRSLDEALVQWQSTADVRRAIDGGERWEVARNHVAIINGAPRNVRAAERLYVAEHLVANFDPESEDKSLIGFLRELAPEATELTRIEAAAGERLARTRGDAMKAIAQTIAAALPSSNATLENLAVETFRRLPPERRRLDDLSDLEAVFVRRGGSLPPAVLEDVLREWTFSKMPKWNEIKSLMARLTSRARLEKLEENKALLSSLGSVPHGQIALELVRARLGSVNDRALLDLTDSYPDQAADVIAAQESIASELAVQLIARVASKSKARGHATSKNDALVPKFVEHLERSANDALLSDERVQFAMQWAGARNAELKRRIDVVRSRFEGLSAEHDLHELLLAPTRAWKPGQSGAIRQLLSVISGEPRWGWYVAAELHADEEFPLVAFCEDLRNEGEAALALLRMIGTLVLHAADRPRRDAVDVLSRCIEASRTPNDTELRRRMSSAWTPSGSKEYARMLALLSAYTTKNDHENQRVQGLKNMAVPEQLEAIASRLTELSIAIRGVAAWPELARLKTLAEEKAEIDFSVVENALGNVLKSLDETSLDRVLKEHASRLRGRKKGGWLPR